MPSKAKSKGSSGEREIAQFLSELYQASFIRVPTSGAYVGGKNSFRKEFLSAGQILASKGDIIPPDHLPKLVIESKYYADFPFHLLLFKEPVLKLEEWIKQTIDCINPGDVWFLIIKINRRGHFVLFDAILKDQFELNNYVLYNKKYVMTEFKDTFIKNKDKIAELCSNNIQLIDVTKNQT
jgi:hypothetical protein